MAGGGVVGVGVAVGVGVGVGVGVTVGAGVGVGPGDAPSHELTKRLGVDESTFERTPAVDDDLIACVTAAGLAVGCVLR